MRMRKGACAVLTGLLVSTTIAGCHTHLEQPQTGSSETSSSQLTNGADRIAHSDSDEVGTRLGVVPWQSNDRELNGETITSALKQLRDRDRVVPDQRLCGALIEIDRALTGAGDAQVSCVFANDRWRVSYNGRQIGSLQEFPTYDQYWVMLNGFAQKRIRENGLSLVHDTKVIPLPDSLGPGRALKILTELLDTSSGKVIEQSRLVALSDICTYLAINCPDLLECNDQLYSMAITYTLLADSGDQHCLSNRVLLYHSMGYEREAERLAARLPPLSVARSYVDAQVAPLQLEAKNSSYKGLPVLLMLKVLARKNAKSEWFKVAKLAYQADKDQLIPILNAYISTSTGQSDLPLSFSLVSACLSELEHNGAQLSQLPNTLDWSYELQSSSAEWSLNNIGKDFDAALDSYLMHSHHSVAGEALVRRCYESILASSVFLTSRNYLNLPGSKASCNLLSQSLSTSKALYANELSGWIQKRLELKDRALTLEQLRQYLRQLKFIRQLGKFVLCQDFGNWYSAGEPSTLRALGRLSLEQLDSRPDHLDLLFRICMATNFDFELAHRISNAAYEKDDIQAASNKSTRFDAVANVESTLRSDDYSLRDKLMILGKLAHEPKYPQVALRRHFLSLKKQYADETISLKEIDWLIAVGNYKEAKAIARTHASAMLTAKEPENLGKYLAVLADLGDGSYVIDLENAHPELSDNLSMIIARIKALRALRRVSELAQWASELPKSFPAASPRSSAVFVYALILSERFDRAAELLKQRYGVSATSWRYEMAPNIVSALTELSPSKVQSCLDFLGREKCLSEDDYISISRESVNRNKQSLAGQILDSSLLFYPSSAQLIIANYSILRRQFDLKRSSDWLLLYISKHRIEPSSLAFPALAAGQLEALATIRQHYQSSNTAEMNLCLAAASCLDPSLKSLVSDSLPGEKLTNLLTGYLIGNKDIETITALPFTPEQLCIASFYLAWKDLAAGRNFYRSAELLKLCQESNCVQLPEQQYSWSLLQLIDNAVGFKPDKSLSVKLEKNDGLGAAYKCRVLVGR